MKRNTINYKINIFKNAKKEEEILGVDEEEKTKETKRMKERRKE